MKKNVFKFIKEFSFTALILLLIKMIYSIISNKPMFTTTYVFFLVIFLISFILVRFIYQRKERENK